MKSWRGVFNLCTNINYYMLRTALAKIPYRFSVYILWFWQCLLKMSVRKKNSKKTYKWMIRFTKVQYAVIVKNVSAKYLISISKRNILMNEHIICKYSEGKIQKSRNAKCKNINNKNYSFFQNHLFRTF